jgi:hypothetical protein
MPSSQVLSDRERAGEKQHKLQIVRGHKILTEFKLRMADVLQQEMPRTHSAMRFSALGFLAVYRFKTFSA